MFDYGWLQVLGLIDARGIMDRARGQREKRLESYIE